MESDKRVVAVIWGVSCHPVGSPTPHALSANFPGAVRSTLRAALGKHIPVLFLQGFSGDVRPNFTTRRPPHGLRPLVSYALAGGRAFLDPPSEIDYAEWCVRLGSHALVTLKRHMSAKEAMVGTSNLYTQTLSPPWARSPSMQHVRLARSLSVLAVNAEVVNERTTSVQAMVPDGHVIPAGCCNEVLGYWPTDAMRRQGGYEGGGAECYFPKLDWDAAGGPDQVWESTLSGVFAPIPANTHATLDPRDE